MNIPNSNRKDEIPEEAEGNPVYEQTRQDMPCWCCGRNCGRNTRFAVLIISMIGFVCSIWACFSKKYFTFVQLRNDTFYDPAKYQPDPFRYATEANVGLFRYEILDVFEFPWPPRNERVLFEDLLREELERLQEAAEEEHKMANDFVEVVQTDAPVLEEMEPEVEEVRFLQTEEEDLDIDGNETEISDAPTQSPTLAPVFTLSPTSNCSEPILPGPGSVVDCDGTRAPTIQPSSAPTGINPNDIIAQTVDIGVVKKYKDGESTLDSVFRNAQRGAVMGPVFAGLGMIFASIELCCCTYKCSWLPPALFLYLAFMFQLFTMFLFLTEDFCKYDQDCALGHAGFASVIAVICYMFAQAMVCCSPRPPPIFKCCKKKKVKKKKKKKKDDEDDSFRDEPSGNGYPYDDDDYGDESYMGDPSYAGQSFANRSQADQSYADGSYYSEDPGDASYYSGDQGDASYYSGDHGDASYYTEDQGDGTYYTEDQGDGTYYTEDQGDASYYTEDQGDASYYTEGQGDYDSQYDDGSGYYNNNNQY